MRLRSGRSKWGNSDSRGTRCRWGGVCTAVQEARGRPGQAGGMAQPCSGRTGALTSPPHCPLQPHSWHLLLPPRKLFPFLK